VCIGILDQTFLIKTKRLIDLSTTPLNWQIKACTSSGTSARHVNISTLMECWTIRKKKSMALLKFRHEVITGTITFFYKVHVLRCIYNKCWKLLFSSKQKLIALMNAVFSYYSLKVGLFWRQFSDLLNL
jgi:hypothetical protein